MIHESELKVHELFQIDMYYTLQSLYTPNIVDLCLKNLRNRLKSQKLNVTNGP